MEIRLFILNRITVFLRKFGRNGVLIMGKSNKYLKLKLVPGMIMLLLFITIGATYYLEFYKESLNKVLPMTSIMKLDDENNRYQIEEGELKVTYDNGHDWNYVPVSIDELFAGDYSGPKKALIDGSYVITPDRTAFVIGEEIVIDGDYSSTNFMVLQSTDKGKTWKRTYVTNSPGVRVRFLGFTSEQNGYLIISYDRTMGFEVSAIYKANDGGQNWMKVGTVNNTNRHITSGGFINEYIGFMSFGSISVNFTPERPSLYRTTDGGGNWEEIEIPIPIEYKGIFTIAEVPTFDGLQGTLLVNQGSNGDYQGGKVLARFTTIDEGASWSFVNLIDH